MSARKVRAALICSALFGAVAISCAGPPVYVVAPAPPLAAEHAAEAAPASQQGGLAEVAEPAQAAPAPVRAAPPAQAAIPAPAPKAVPAPAAPPAPALPPRRRGGAPPGTELVDLPGGNNIKVTKWMGVMAKNCGDHGATCLAVRKSYVKQESCDDSDGIVESQNPPLKKGAKVLVGSAVTLKIDCSQANTDTGNNQSNTDPGN